MQTTATSFLMRQPARKTTKARYAMSGKTAPVPKRIPREELDSFARGAVPAIDATLVNAMRTALAPVSSEIIEACIQRKLFPHSVSFAIEWARFLSHVLVAARAAQLVTGCPASILIAEACQIAGLRFDESLSDSNDVFGTGQRFSSIGAAFMDHANRLTRDGRFQSVLLAKDDPAEYLKQVGLCKLWDELGRKDRVADIAGRCLRECDAVPSSESE
jgi:hypothetical protein